MDQDKTPGQIRTAAATKAAVAAARRRRVAKYVKLLEDEGYSVSLVPLTGSND